ncbi:AcrR family transcriptional regulator [Pseudomonas nitritireducens]|uniref:AcrR family transcriptional regulator n=1 Tax=Pseudomonas nitroreducens TaxID=46680 RepID=A0A7W7P1I7_PSENT|nr:TetR/AcrR family transcriptional regulator [Pseudomonas nitritireducens]MBB4864878.1 AcrR family transcriptional regulator [Pseudomonas nitritireducens]
MPRKVIKNQEVARRTPRQARALEKVDLILEASRQLLERDGLDGFTTDSVAERAGVSVGTLYQYFPNKQRILDELAQREMSALVEDVMVALTREDVTEPGGRIRAMVGAIVNAYGGRAGVHPVLVNYLLTRHGSTPLPQLRLAIIEHMKANGLAGAGQQLREVDENEAFVLTHSVSGVLRAMLNDPQTREPERRKGIEDALIKLLLNF